MLPEWAIKALRIVKPWIVLRRIGIWENGQYYNKWHVEYSTSVHVFRAILTGGPYKTKDVAFKNFIEVDNQINRRD